MIAVAQNKNFWAWDFKTKESCTCVGDKIVILSGNTMNISLRPEGFDFLNITASGRV